jgi:hypothetical protein
VWPFEWLNGMKGALPRESISEEHYPKVFAWIARFKKAVNAARASAPKPATLKGDEALQRITSSGFWEPEGQVDENDPLKLKKGQEIEVQPTDSGFSHRDRGHLVALNAAEVVLQAPTKQGNSEVRIHCPRINFRITPASSSAASRL